MAKRNTEGMRYPSVDKLLEKVDSKYKLAYVAARRARVIEDEQGYIAEDINSICAKPVGQSLEEVLADKVSVEFAPADTIFTNALNENTEKSDK